MNPGAHWQMWRSIRLQWVIGSFDFVLGGCISCSITLTAVEGIVSRILRRREVGRLSTSITISAADVYI